MGQMFKYETILSPIQKTVMILLDRFQNADNEGISTYQLHKSIGKIAYKNIHKHVKHMERLGLIKRLDKQDIGYRHAAIYYEITTYGIAVLDLLDQLDDITLKRSEYALEEKEMGL